MHYLNKWLNFQYYIMDNWICLLKYACLPFKTFQYKLKGAKKIGHQAPLWSLKHSLKGILKVV